MAQQAERELDWQTGRDLERKDAELDKLREACRIARVHAPLIKLAPERRYTIKALDDALGLKDDRMETAEILPCPFCSSRPEVMGSGEGQRGLMIHCVGADCPNPSVSYYDHETAKRVWNRRRLNLKAYEAMIRTPIEWMTILHNYTEPKRSAVILDELETLYGLEPRNDDDRARCLANAIDACLRLETGHP